MNARRMHVYYGHCRVTPNQLTTPQYTRAQPLAHTHNHTHNHNHNHRVWANDGDGDGEGGEGLSTETLMELAVTADEFLLPGLLALCEWELCSPRVRGCALPCLLCICVFADARALVVFVLTSLDRDHRLVSCPRGAHVHTHTHTDTHKNNSTWRGARSVWASSENTRGAGAM
jgi:hypothetical protein